MKDKMLKICKEVLEENWTSDGNIGCDGIVCEDCIFGDTFQDCNRRDTDMFKHLAKEYISKYAEKVAIKYEPKFKVGDIVTGVNSSQWAYDGKYKISELLIEDGIARYGLTPMDNNTYCYPDCVWLGEDLELVEYYNDSNNEVHSVNKYTYKELIAEWDNINQDDRYIGVGNNYGLTIYKDTDGGVSIEYEDGVLGNEVLYIDIEGLFELQKPLTLDDFEIGEEFRVKDMDGRFMKIEIFDTILIARKYDNYVKVVTKSKEYLKDETLIKIKGDK